MRLIDSMCRTLLVGLACVLSACSGEPASTDVVPSAASPVANLEQADRKAEVYPALPLQSTGADGLTVMVLGDSISAAYGIARKDGWVELLKRRLDESNPGSKVINASVSGETTQGGRSRLQAALERHAPEVMFLELGGNDALRGYPVSKMRDNLNAMINMAQSAGARVIVLGMQIPPNYGPKYTREFAESFTQVTQESGAYLVPFFLEGVALVDGMIQSDGIHPTTKAQPILLDTGWQALLGALSP